MLEIIFMLMGLAFPNSDVNTTSSDNQTIQTEITTTFSDGSGVTGGNNGQNPPKNL